MRRKARESAIQALYQIDVRRAPDAAEIRTVLQDHFEEFVDLNSVERAYAESLVHGALLHKTDLDARLNAASHRWRLERMGGVDRNILRISAYEIVYCPDVPAAVSINEAVEIARTFASADAASFVNGILDHVSRHCDAGGQVGDGESD